MPLATFLERARDEGRPVWHVTDHVVVPRLYWTVQGSRPNVSPAQLPRTVLIFLKTGDPDASLAIKAKSEARVLDRLTAAVMRDVLTLTPEHITDCLGYKNRGEAKKLAREGRELWRRLGAWPWWDFGEGLDTLRAGWWEDLGTVERLHDWRTGSSRRQREGRAAGSARLRVTTWRPLLPEGSTITPEQRTTINRINREARLAREGLIPR
ncbi:MAG TPA: hypothetical protein VII01_10210 [Solirubrobacteraceae bacterium]